MYHIYPRATVFEHKLKKYKKTDQNKFQIFECRLQLTRRLLRHIWGSAATPGDQKPSETFNLARRQRVVVEVLKRLAVDTVAVRFWQVLCLYNQTTSTSQ